MVDTPCFLQSKGEAEKVELGSELTSYREFPFSKVVTLDTNDLDK